MNAVWLHMILFLLLGIIACTKKPESIVNPTMGSLRIIADESIKDIVEQEEEIFERTYKYADLDISYLNEYDMFSKFLEDSIHVIMTTRPLTKEEVDFFNEKKSFPRQFAFATGAIAFIANKAAKDTSYTYEEMISMLGEDKSGKPFVIENVKSGITQEILRLIDKKELPKHYYTLDSKLEVLKYVQEHEQAIGIVDYTGMSDSDFAFTREVLESIQLLGISRPVDSLQDGFVKPFQYNLQDWKYPFTRELYMINRTGRTDVAIGFASFITGEIGQKIILKAGLLPKYQTVRSIELNSISDIKVVK